MKTIHRFGLAAVVAVLAACSSPQSTRNSTTDTETLQAQAIDGQVLTVAPGGNANLRANPLGADGGIQVPEFPPALGDEGSSNDNLHSFALKGGLGSGNNSFHTRTPAKQVGSLSIPSASAGGGSLPSTPSAAATRPGTLLASLDGINFRQQRLANGGNQFSVEPPDQGLCVGNGYVLESVNTALRIFKTDGTPATGVIDLNTFYGYPAAINRTTGVRGPFLTDPVCIYDQETGRWFHITLTLGTNPATGAFTGKNSLDIAVSLSKDPTGAWVIYRVPSQNDGTDGTPDHGCSAGADSGGNPVGHGPCLADYPQISTDGEGLYITTNEFSFFGPEFKSANIYAISKRDLIAPAALIRVVNFQTVSTPAGVTGYTIQGAHHNGTNFVNRFGGTQYFMSTNTVLSSTDNNLVLWALTNTRSLSSRNPNLKLTNGLVQVNPYGDPSPVRQKAGDFPLGQCINDTTLPTPLGNGCWRFLFTAEPAHNEVLSQVAANDSRMHQVTFEDDLLWGANPTAINVGGSEQAGVAYYLLKPKLTKAGITGEVKRQGYLLTLNNNLIFPEIAVNKQGKGVMAFTLVGADHYPSAGFATISEDGVGPIQVAAEGLGPQDGFSGYKAFGNPPRPRWGDYGGAAVDPATQNIWIASEYIGQTCTLAQYVSSPFGSCGGTRATLGNWGTRISLVQP